jgi:hypothetical protein
LRHKNLSGKKGKVIDVSITHSQKNGSQMRFLEESNPREELWQSM